MRNASFCVLNVPIIMWGKITIQAINSVNCNNTRVIRQSACKLLCTAHKQAGKKKVPEEEGSKNSKLATKQRKTYVSSETE